MGSNLATTVLLSTSCSGGCKHCPFSAPDIEKLFLPTQLVQKILSYTDRKLVVLSGGEPFEHPEISEILSLPFEQLPQFRIATGGFVDLLPWIDKLMSLIL